MYKFKNGTTKDFWEQYKAYCKPIYSPVPNTAAGYEETRCYITTIYDHKYLLSAITEKDYFLNYDMPGQGFSIWFRLEGDMITITQACEKGKTYKAERYLKKYGYVAAMAACAITFDNAVSYVRYVTRHKITITHIATGIEETHIIDGLSDTGDRFEIITYPYGTRTSYHKSLFTYRYAGIA